MNDPSSDGGWTQEEQLDALRFELDNIISRYCSEFDLSCEAILGIIEIVKLDFWKDRNIEFEMDGMGDL